MDSSYAFQLNSKYNFVLLVFCLVCQMIGSQKHSSMANRRELIAHEVALQRIYQRHSQSMVLHWYEQLRSHYGEYIKDTLKAWCSIDMNNWGRITENISKTLSKHGAYKSLAN